MMFYLGTHAPHWVASIANVPFFVSRRRLAGRRTFPRALSRWALDSGGFSELNLHGEWTVTPAQYVIEVRQFASEIGSMDWAAIQDWMCEPFILAKTGLSVKEHQRRTIESYIELLYRAPDLPWLPVLQGWDGDDYLRHVESYDAAQLPIHDRVIGVGSVCRRQGLVSIVPIIAQLHNLGLRLHGFGVKIKGLPRLKNYLESADSMAWSFKARQEKIRLPNHSHINCANCLPFALQWRENVLQCMQ